jgi:hypothetical protein
MNPKESKEIAVRLQQLIARSKWTGTTFELHRWLTYDGAEDVPPPAHLGRWLHRNEPTLWWDYGVTVNFSRSGYERLLQLSRRGEHVASGLRRLTVVK